MRVDDRELIESAALVANVGYLINFEGHHKDSYHLIVNSELAGFERRQLQFAERLAVEGGALVSPGDFYGAGGAQNVRVAVVQPDQRIALMAQRLGVS